MSLSSAILDRVALLLFRNDGRCRHGRRQEAPGPAPGIGPGAAGAPIAGAGPAIGGRRGPIPAAAGGRGGLPPGAPTPGGGIPGVACAGACGAGGVENGLVPSSAGPSLWPIISAPFGFCGRSSRTFTGPAAGSISPMAFAWNSSEHASSNSGWRTVDMPSSGAEDETDVVVAVSITSPSSLKPSDNISKCSRRDSSSRLIPSSNSLAMVFSSPSSIFAVKFA